MNEHVLVAEDSRTQAHAVRLQLEEAGYRVTICADGLSALQELGEGGVDAVVSDVVMPGLNGYELCGRVKSDPELASTPVLLLTSLRDPLDIVHALEAGADGFLTKPTPATQLTGRLRALLESRDRKVADELDRDLDVLFMGHRVSVSADRQQVVDVLMSSFEELIRANRVLHQREGELAAAQQDLERHLVEAEEARVRLDRSLQLSGVGAWEFDLDHETMLWSEHVEPLYGLPSGRLGAALDDILVHVHPDDRDRVHALLAAARSHPTVGAVVDEFDYRVVHPGGAVRWVRLRFAVTAERRLVGVALDVTDQVALQGELSAARDEAEEANRAKSEFLSRMSHELRTPLNAILGFGQLLREAEGLDAEDREGVRHIVTAGRHLLQLIDEVLDISRIESGNVSVELTTVDVSEVVGQSLHMVRGMAGEHGVRLHPTSGGPAFVAADRRRLQQVVINLLSNAIKYNRRGGEVTVCWERTDDSEVVIEVHDTGMGIAREQLDRLFVPFDRLGAEATDVEGTGLGLSLSAHLVALMHGRLEVCSGPGVGSVFTVTLPVVEPPGDSAHAPAAGPVAAGTPRGSVVYIEDNASNVQLVRRVLHRRPMVELLGASDGTTGTALVRECRPQLVLLDLQLPDQSGLEVLAGLRADPQTQDVPVVVLSADLAAGQAERLRDAGADGFLAKPFDVAALLDVIDTMLKDAGS